MAGSRGDGVGDGGGRLGFHPSCPSGATRGREPNVFIPGHSCVLELMAGTECWSFLCARTYGGNGMLVFLKRWRRRCSDWWRKSKTKRSNGFQLEQSSYLKLLEQCLASSSLVHTDLAHTPGSVLCFFFCETDQCYGCKAPLM
jgi:hypothetical protein